MYRFTVPLLRRALGVLSTYIVGVRKHAHAHGLDESMLLSARLAPDMLPFSGQIQRASDKAKNGVARLAEIVAPSFADTETTSRELEERIANTVAFLDSVKPSLFVGADKRTVELRFRSVNGAMSGQTYLTQVLLPDVYFHVATAHGILRNNGIDVGKADYLGVPDYLK
jgi:hypothetical protein